MSPMLDIQQRHSEVFRIRLGDMSNGKPRKLTDAIRLTSHSREIVTAFTDVYGGEVQPWVSPKGPQFEAYLPTTSLAVLVLPGQSITQWWELYKKSTVERRCDGVAEQLSGKPCMCPADVDVRVKTPGACRPMTRLAVLCPDVAVIGAGGLVTHGLIAAETLPQSIKVAEASLARGIMVPATLRVVKHEGKTHYVYPQLEIHGISLMELLPADSGAIAGRGVAALAAPARTAIDAPKVPPRTDAPEGRAVSEGPPMPPLPHEQDQHQDLSVARTADGRGEAAGDLVPPAASAAHPTTDKPPVNRVAIAAREAGLDDDGRHDLAAYISSGRTRSSSELIDDEQAKAIALAKRIGSGEVHLTLRDDELVLLDGRFGWPAREEAIEGASSPSIVEQVGAMSPRALNAALTERGLAVDGTGDDRRQRLVDAMGEDPF